MEVRELIIGSVRGAVAVCTLTMQTFIQNEGRNGLIRHKQCAVDA